MLNFKTFGGGGYKDYSRSNRSAAAIEAHEMPLSMFNKERIGIFLKDAKEENYLETADFYFLKTLPVNLWKFAAKDLGRASWHHTSSHYNKTDHFCLYSISDHLAENYDDIVKRHKEHQKHQKQAEQNKALAYGVLKVEVWGGTRNRPKLEGHEVIAGIIDGDWLYHKSGRNNIYANKVVKKHEYSSYKELVKAFPQFKGTVKVFNQIKKQRKA